MTEELQGVPSAALANNKTKTASALTELKVALTGRSARVAAFEDRLSALIATFLRSILWRIKVLGGALLFVFASIFMLYAAWVMLSKFVRWLSY